MTFRLGTGLVALTFSLAACSNGTASFDSAALDSDDQKASYGIGLNVGSQIADSRDRLDRAAFMRGVEDALQGNQPAVPREELQPALETFAEEVQAAAAEARQQEAVENAEAGESFLEENAQREEVTTTESGLQYEVLQEGDGPVPTAEDEVEVHYQGTLIDGTEFDSSYGGDPATFGVGAVIPGFAEALQLMPVGSEYRVWIPSELGYGEQGSGPVIGPNSVLVFDIELLDIVE
ncbi:MAG: FKBP-type peptidyl-prolyl cis-trans isomerase [Gemmatimonadota bacterium]|nr:FKBP-type peptidyl-prolyl cis-trans isomerase [Gemmatimonadota bacterium]